MDKRLVQLAAGVAVITALGGIAGAGSDRGVVADRAQGGQGREDGLAHRARDVVVVHAQASDGVGD